MKKDTIVALIIFKKLSTLKAFRPYHHALILWLIADTVRGRKEHPYEHVILE